MASLRKPLSEDGFQRKKPTKKVKFRNRNTHPDSITLPIYICHDRRSFDSYSRHRPDKTLSAAAASVVTSSKKEPAIDDVAIKAMIAILSGYVGQYLEDASFRANIREKCRACFERRREKGLDDEILARMETEMQRVERLAEETSEMEMELESLQKCIKNLNVVASLNSTNSSNDPSCRKTNSYLSSVASLYLAIIYKIARNDKISARQLLQVFCDAPFLARTQLLPELWDHFFLPHLLHLKIWYNRELVCLGRMDDADRERKIKCLNHLYREQMDVGTIQFALYYKEWLKLGVQAPTIPSVPLPPSKSTLSRRKSLESSTSGHSSGSKLRNRAVLGSKIRRQSMEFDDGNGASRNVWDLEREDVKHCDYVEKRGVAYRRSSSQSYETQKAELFSDSFRFFGCRAEPSECSPQPSHASSNEINNLSGMDAAIAAICSSGSLTDCEAAIRAVSEAWLEGQDRSQLEASLSRASVIEGIMEVLYLSNDEETLEMAVSILAEIAAKSEASRQLFLTSDPHLAVSMRLLRSSSLFLKAAVLLYMVKPKANHMASMEWIPLVLRVLEFGDHQQTLLTARCSPHEAAYYLLDQLVTGFDEDRNFENARQIICLGGLGLLVRRMDVGDASEKSRAASLLRHCIRADGSCRHYLTKNLKKHAILELLASSQGHHALELLSELLCISRIRRREFLTELKEGWDCFNALQILVLRLQRARAEEKPVIAAVLLEIDLMGDAAESSAYRDEAVDAITEALECLVFDERIQMQAARALMILGGHFSYTGEGEAEQWLLRKATNEDNIFNMSEEEETLQRKAAEILLSSGNKRLLSALAHSMANSVPRLARASLVTISWISSYLHMLGERDLVVAACSILVPHLVHCLIDNSSNLDERILASFSLYSLTNGADCLLQQLRMEEGVLGSLQKLSRSTWTAKELVSLITNASSESL